MHGSGGTRSFKRPDPTPRGPRSAPHGPLGQALSGGAELLAVGKEGLDAEPSARSAAARPQELEPVGVETQGAQDKPILERHPEVAASLGYCATKPEPTKTLTRFSHEMGARQHPALELQAVEPRVDRIARQEVLVGAGFHDPAGL